MKKFFLFLILTLFLFFIFQTDPTRAASSNQNFIKGLKTTGEASGVASDEAAKDPGTFLIKMFGGIMAPIMMGVIAMLILSYGGYTLIMSRGNEQEVEKAKAIIINTLIALIVVFSSYVIVTLMIPLWEFVTK